MFITIVSIIPCYRKGNTGILGILELSCCCSFLVSYIRDIAKCPWICQCQNNLLLVVSLGIFESILNLTKHCQERPSSKNIFSRLTIACEYCGFQTGRRSVTPNKGTLKFRNILFTCQTTEMREHYDFFLSCQSAGIRMWCHFRVVFAAKRHARKCLGSRKEKAFTKFLYPDSSTSCLVHLAETRQLIGIS